MAVVEAGLGFVSNGQELAEYLDAESELNKQKNAFTYQQGDYRKEEERVELSFFINMERVCNVDLVNQTFEAQFDLELVWRATEDDDRRFDADPEHYRPSFVPVIKFPNGNIDHFRLKKKDGRSFIVFKVGQPDVWGNFYPEEKLKCKALNQALYSVSGQFSEPFELGNFPMDVQDLQITIRVLRNSDSIVFELPQHNDVAASISPSVFMSVSDYAVHPPIWEYWMQTRNRQDTVRYIPHATFRMKVARKWSIYFWRIGIFTMILSMCCLFVFTLDHQDVSDRYETLLTLLLAAVAFQYIINNELPKLPYLTLVDVYVLFSFAFVFIVIVLVSVSGYFEVEESTDNLFCYTASAVFIVFHLCFAIKGYKARVYEMAKIGMNRWQYEEHGYDENKEEQEETTVLWGKDIHMDTISKEKMLERPWWTADDLWDSK